MDTIPVFFGSDDKVAPYLAVSIASICSNTASIVDFYVMDSGISLDNKDKIKLLKDTFTNCNIEFIKIDTRQYFNGFAFDARISLATYNRLLIPVIAPHIDKAIYLDVDTIALGDVCELFSEKLDGFAVGAVIFQTFLPYHYKYKESVELDLKSIYFNAGVLLMDCIRWREENITDKLLAIAYKYRSTLVAGKDQSTLNKYFENNFKVLPARYNNWIGGDTVISHFKSVIKPWNYEINELGKRINGFDDFWHFARMTPFYDRMFAVYNENITKYKVIVMTYDVLRKAALKSKKT